MKKKDNDVRVGSARKWHAWQDAPGIRQAPCFYTQGVVHAPQGAMCVANVEEMIEAVAGHGLFSLCNDILDEQSMPFVNDMLGHCKATPYLSKTGSISALRLKRKRAAGFLVPATTWKWYQEPGREIVEYVTQLFQLFDYQSTTPASLSEKVLRSTLPEKIRIYRPSLMLRRDILAHHVGGRIDPPSVPGLYTFGKEYDKIKAYPDKSRLTMSPFKTPMYVPHPGLDEFFSFACAFGEVSLIAHETLLCPIQVDGRAPAEGQCITRWLWSDELHDCIEAGYTIVSINKMWCWREMSNWMEEWANILYAQYEQARNESPWFGEIIKVMMVGLPGRFLHAPEYYTLIPAGEGVEGRDIPLMMNWHGHGEKMFSDYAIHPNYDPESTALCAIGSYIVMAMRHELYQRMLKEVMAGRTLLGSYIDNFKLDGETVDEHLVGTGLGQYKQYDLENVYVESNRLVARMQGNDIIKAPSFDQEQRVALWRKYRRLQEESNNGRD